MARSKTRGWWLAGLLALSLGGCIQPVHQPTLGGPSRIAQELAQVSVDRIDGYLGYQLKSELDYLLTGGGSPVAGGRYILKVKTQQSKASSIIDASTGRAQIATLQIEAVYVLIDQQQGGRIRASARLSRPHPWTAHNCGSRHCARNVTPRKRWQNLWLNVCGSSFLPLWRGTGTPLLPSRRTCLRPILTNPAQILPTKVDGRRWSPFGLLTSAASLLATDTQSALS